MWWALVAACMQSDEPAEPGEERVLQGPLLGRGVAVAGGAVWATAPGVVGGSEAFAVAFDGGVTATRTEAAAVVSGVPGQLGDAVAACALDGPSVVLGAPDEGVKGGSWWYTAPAGPVAVADGLWVEGLWSGGRAGAAVGCGDLDGDGIDEVAVAAPDVSEGGLVEVYVAEGADKVADLVTAWPSAALGTRTGLASGHDLDGDGLGDLVVGAPGADQVHVVPGAFTGSWTTATIGSTFSLQDERHGLGHAVAAGDVTGDGQDDLLVGAPLAVAEQGGVWVVPGPIVEGGVISTVGRLLPGAGFSDRAGFSVAVVGDVDGDGRADWLTGAPLSGGVGPEAGAVYLVLGSGEELYDLDSAPAILVGDQPWARFGWSVAGGDLDGDGVPELVAGAPESDVGERLGVGRVFVFDGSIRGRLDPSAARATLDVE